MKNLQELELAQISKAELETRRMTVMPKGRSSQNVAMSTAYTVISNAKRRLSGFSVTLIRNAYKTAFMGIYRLLFFMGAAFVYQLCVQGQVYLPQKPIILDVEKKYPLKDIVLEEISEVHYAPLETTKDILLDGDRLVQYISDRRIVITNPRIGDVFIFGHDGKIIFHWNNRGAIGYNQILSSTYDEKNKKIFILDSRGKKIIVYSEDGKYKRRFILPEDVTLGKIYNFG
jgi:hypothetical protein